MLQLPLDIHLSQCEVEERKKQYLREVETYRLLREISAGQRRGLARLLFRALSLLGRALVALGRHLQSFEMRPASVSIK